MSWPLKLSQPGNFNYLYEEGTSTRSGHLECVYLLSPYAKRRQNNIYQTNKKIYPPLFSSTTDVILCMAMFHELPCAFQGLNK